MPNPYLLARRAAVAKPSQERSIILGSDFLSTDHRYSRIVRTLEKTLPMWTRVDLLASMRQGDGGPAFLFLYRFVGRKHCYRKVGTLEKTLPMRTRVDLVAANGSNNSGSWVWLMSMSGRLESNCLGQRPSSTLHGKNIRTIFQLWEGASPATRLALHG